MPERAIKQFLINMQLLGYKPNSKDFFKDLRLFETSKKSQFENMVVFLFQILDSSKANLLFSECVPCISHQHSQKFRMACVNWWKTISHDNQELNLPRVTGMMLKDLCGDNIIDLMLKFSCYVLRQKTQELSDPNSVLRLPPNCSGVLREIQKSSISAARNSEFKKFNTQLRIVQQEKINLTNYIDKHSKGYREAIKKNIELRELRNKLLAKEAPKSYPRMRKDSISFSENDYENARKLINKTLTANRKMNKSLSMSLAHMKSGQEIINLILSQDKHGKICLDADSMDVRVPSLLLNKHTDEVYKKIGTSLYKNGFLNMQSVASLFNLSLCLLNEKLHTDGLPNFESDLGHAKAQIHIIMKNSSTLYNLHQRTVLQNPIISSRIAENKQQLKIKCSTSEISNELPTSTMFVSPQKFPWSKKQDELSIYSPQHDKIPMLSLGSHVTHLPSPARIQKLSEPQPTHFNSTIIENTHRSPHQLPKKTLKKTKVNVSKPIKQLQSIENVFNCKATPQKKPKTSSEQALSNLVATVVNDIVENDLQSSVSKFDISSELTETAFKSRPLLANSPQLNETVDSVFEKTVNDSFDKSLPQYILTKKFDKKIAPPTAALNSESNAPSSAMSIESRFFKEQSRIYTTDESEFEKTVSGGDTPVFDLLNDEVEIPKEYMSESSEEEIETLTNESMFKTANVPTANLLDLSFAPSFVENPALSINPIPVVAPDTVVPDLIDFSGF